MLNRLLVSGYDPSRCGSGGKKHDGYHGIEKCEHLKDLRLRQGCEIYAEWVGDGFYGDNKNAKFKMVECPQKFKELVTASVPQNVQSSVAQRNIANRVFGFTNGFDFDPKDPNNNAPPAPPTPAPTPKPDKPTPKPDKPTPKPDKPTPKPIPNFPTPYPDMPTPIPDTPTPNYNIPTPIPDIPTPIPDFPTPIPDFPTPIPEYPTPMPDLIVDVLYIHHYYIDP